jgi:hypothetical protein
MAQFLKGNQLNAQLERIFDEAQAELILISPYIKIHSRFRDILRSKKENAKLQISIVFGKNDKDYWKSFSKEDFELLKEFPNVEIKYESRLHAKYYANEMTSLLSSMNLYDYSQNNNIEFGISMNEDGMNALKGMITNGSMDIDAMDYFNQVIKNSQTLYRAVPQFESKMMGMTKKYTHSEVEVDELTEKLLAPGNPKTKWKKPAAPSFKQKTKAETKSASQIGKLHGMSAVQVTKLMEAKGLVRNGQITDAGRQYGLEMKKYMGNEYIAYPVNIEVI